MLEFIKTKIIRNAMKLSLVPFGKFLKVEKYGVKEVDF